MKFLVTKDTLIGEVLNADPNTVNIFYENGMECAA